MDSFANYINTLRDVSGLPFYPWLFDILLVFTFTCHILLVNLVLGGSIVLLWGKLSGNPYGGRLSRSLSRVLPISLSWAIVLGVAPLLFIQVIYDPFWYFSSVISAWWTLAFLALIALAFSLFYVYYLRGGYEGQGNPLWVFLALAALSTVAVIIHALSLQAVHPERWSEWVVKGGRVNFSGSGLYAFELPRILHFILASVAIIGIFLMLYARYFRARPDYPSEYLAWVERTGARTAFVFSLLQAGAGIWWFLTLPRTFHFYIHPLFLIGAGFGITLIVVLALAQARPSAYTWPVTILAFLTVFFMSYAREALRMKYLHRAGYSFADYPVHPSWSSTALFLLTFVMGLVILFYVGLVAFRAGRGHKEVGSHGLGKLAVTLSCLWIGIMVVIGLVISFKNGALP
ncbi:hypothetical protein [Thermosulfurimonas dismutans]|uniref:Uncharacterized protein n=1 Tax=Thermosulfurimonas dismutans TaxID=999894 RepID=A0A179D464_9BACT|nr:hypothetical protein [Thermosulfurimonas dismutans]OAQ20418.1 hypothetical protein TDIS_1462 [Thermosulfurimonas dismutans]